MVAVENAIEKAFAAHVTSLYKVLSQAVLTVNGDAEEIKAAQARFKKGLTHAEEIRQLARAAAGL